MKKITLYFLLFIPFLAFSQAYQTSAPWMQDNNLKKKGKITLDDISIAAEKYFSTIDRFKKGSGYKPFMRWQYQNGFNTNADGTLKTNAQKQEAWQQKNSMNASEQNNANDTSNWTTLGPFTHTNTASWSSGQGRVNVVVVDPSNANTYYVGTPAGGIWKSTDAGINWQPLMDFQLQIGVSGIAIHPTDSNIIYIATGDDDAGDSSAIGVLKSIDGGTTWNSTGNMSGGSMNDIYIDPTAPNTVIVATNVGVQKSINGGTTWTNTLSGNIKDLKRKPGSSTVFYAASTSTVYVSTDGGDSFSPVSITGFSGSRRIALAVTPANANVIYFVSYNQTSTKNGFNGIYKSLDSGFSFVKTNENDDIFEGSQSWYDLDITVSDTDENIVFVGVLNIWKSTDGGNDFSKLNNWSSPTAANYTHADIHFLNYSGGKFFAGTDGGVYVSTDNGAKFTDLTKNLVIGQFYKISVANQTSGNIVGGLQDNGGYAFKNNGWSVYFGADGMDCAINPLDPNNYFGFIQYGGSLYQSKDGGLTRTSSVRAPAAETGTNDSGGRWVTPLAADRKGNLYAGYSSLYKLVSGAWSKISSHDFGGDLYNIEIDPSDENNIYVSRGSSLYKSTDAGKTFTKLSFNFGTINSIEISNNDSSVGWIVLNGGVYKATNLNTANPTFTNINGNLPFNDNKIVLRHHPGNKDNRIYLGTTLGVYYIDDTLAQWQTFDNNLPNSPVRDIEINEKDAKLIVATYGRGVWTSDIPNSFPDNEIKLVSIDSPIDSSTGCGSIAPTITVQNKGVNAITAVTVNYDIDGGTNSSFNWSGTLASNATTQISIPAFASSVGNHTLNIETIINNDTFTTNNSSSTSFSINASTTTPTTINTFETANDNLVVETFGGTSPFGLWQRGAPQKALLNTVASGTSAYMTSLSGNHPDKTTGYLYTKCYDFTLITNPVLSFKMAFDIEEDWDHMYVEYTIDQGKNWLILGTKNDPNWYNSSSKANGLPGKQWTGEGEDASPLGGTNATLHDYSFDLAAFTNESNVIFRFKFIADDASNEEGALIDDLVITGVLPVEEFSEINGLSISPNPSSSLFNINWSQGTDFAISVFDITGKLVLQQKNNSIAVKRFELDMSKYSTGIYFAKIKVGESQSTKKLILK